MRAFLYRIARNLIIDHSRKKKESSLDVMRDAGFDPGVDPWYQTHNRLDAERPLQMLKKMRKPYRKVLHQRYMLGLRPAEIAKITGESSNVISVRIARGLKNLRVALEESSPSSTRTSSYSRSLTKSRS